MAPPIVIRAVRREDAEAWLRLRCALWPDGAGDHPHEIAAFFAADGSDALRDPLAVFIAECGDRCIALLELAIRTNLPKFPKERVGYIEGLYIEPAFRRSLWKSGTGEEKPVARLLLLRARAWARELHCVALASDRVKYADRLRFDARFDDV